MEQVEIGVVERAELASKAAEMARSGARLVAVTCTSLTDAFEVTYTFDKEYKPTHLRVMVPRTDATIPSITQSYFCAFAYENELQDLFGMKADGLVLDFKGNFYRKAANSPFAEPPAGPKKAA